MNAVEFLREAEAKGIELEFKPPNKIRYRVPKPVPDELIEELRRVKPELIKILQARQSLKLDPSRKAILRGDHLNWLI